VPWSYNRKEAKDHGEGGVVVGASLKGRRVLVVDDVITAGTAVREAFAIIDAHEGTLASVVVALDRQERGATGGASAIQEVEAEFKIGVVSLGSLNGLLPGLAFLFQLRAKLVQLCFSQLVHAPGERRQVIGRLGEGLGHRVGIGKDHITTLLLCWRLVGIGGPTALAVCQRTQARRSKKGINAYSFRSVRSMKAKFLGCSQLQLYRQKNG
jgi:hypothetical protein